jgi:hypothetical protein
MHVLNKAQQAMFEHDGGDLVQDECLSFEVLLFEVVIVSFSLYLFHLCCLLLLL